MENMHILCEIEAADSREANSRLNSKRQYSGSTNCATQRKRSLADISEAIFSLVEDKVFQLCQHCAPRSSVNETVDNDNVDNIGNVDNVDKNDDEVFYCSKCDKQRVERKSIIEEILDTERRYGEDLTLLKEEFLVPMRSSELLTEEQQKSVFLNLEELIDLNVQLTSELGKLLQEATDTGDDEYKTVTIGDLFLRSTSLLLAFESYCINQAQSVAILNQMEKNKEALKNFLEVAQTENSLLRRMSLKSFLLAPVQRLTRYPLLLSRLAKATPVNHCDSEAIWESRKRIEDIIDHINTRTVLYLPTRRSLRLKRKRSNIRRSSFRERSDLKQFAREQLGWESGNTTDVLINQLQYTQAYDQGCLEKKSKHLKLSPVFAVFLTLHQPSRSMPCNSIPLSPKSCPVEQAVLVLIKEKGGRYQCIREPLYLQECVVMENKMSMDLFEVQENKSGETYIFKTESQSESQVWVYHMKQQSKALGRWRRRRNALPDIMIKNDT